jgi:hypothetical protein
MGGRAKEVALGVGRNPSLSDESLSGVFWVDVSSEVESCSFCSWLPASSLLPVPLADPIAVALGMVDSGVVRYSWKVTGSRGRQQVLVRVVGSQD